MTYEQGYADALKAAAAKCKEMADEAAVECKENRLSTLGIMMQDYEECAQVILALPIPDYTPEEQKCSSHPDAPHGFLRSASHTAGRYVCECEGWVPPDGFVVVHATPAIDEECDHSWVGEDGKDYENPDHCSKCGLSFTRYIHCCCF